MERGRAGSPLYVRQKSISSSSGGGASSPMMSPMHRHVRTGSSGVANFRRQQNTAARAAAQRLAHVMAHQPAGDDSDDDEDPAAPLPELSTPRRAARSPSPAVYSLLYFISPLKHWGCWYICANVGLQHRDVEDWMNSDAIRKLKLIGRYLAEQTSTIRLTSAGRPSIAAKPTTLIPPIKPSPRPIITTLASESPVVSRREKRMSIDLGNLNLKETVQTRSSSALQDEIDVLQEENENLLEKLRLAEERCEEAEARARQFEKWVASRAAMQTSGPNNQEVASLRMKAKIARDEAASLAEHLQEAELEIKSLRTLAQKMILSPEEMEEVVLKRCWLARYWKLCVSYGIHADVAETKHEYWSSLAPDPMEVVLSAGQKARDGNPSEIADIEEKDKVQLNVNDLAEEGNIECMILVEKGLRELTSMKVEDAVLLAMARHRRASIKSGSFSGSSIAAEGQNPVEAVELSQEESEDVLFKQAWLTYFWRRVKNHGLEEDIADERLQFWIEQNNHSPTSHDVVEVERGLLELKKLGIESQLWEAARRGSDQDARSQADSEL
ncbi:coiled-coil domain-containing protein SCD2-like [Phoenix dactylifera]|uniref:Coiled-coil domain-containing protein SCD2-like n=1 Tax=Phoenix dactylifera TaxID=42345 RepID=A0A8B8ZAG1_PHODC|nr:coiled-coil domain-containing protein SCD2-like [Phoenix dactylifera]